MLRSPKSKEQMNKRLSIKADTKYAAAIVAIKSKVRTMLGR